MATISPIDFDDTSEGGALKLYRAAYDQADEVQLSRDNQCERDYQMFHAFLDMSLRNPERANIAIPKIYSIVMTKVPREVRAAIGRRPYIPFDAKRDEYKDAASLQVKMLDQLLYQAGFGGEFVLLDMLKTVYGTAFMEARPYYQQDIQRVVVPQMMEGPPGFGPTFTGYEIVNQPVLRLKFELTTYAPWELRFCPMATSLSTPNGCRYAIKIRIVSKRAIRKIAEEGGYGTDFDADLLDAFPNEYSNEVTKHRGLQILQNMGLPAPGQDSDIGILFRYESPDRYIDVWNDHVVLRDGDNPYAKKDGGHGLINLSRCIHNVDPHTQAVFWGNGEVKINEVLGSMLSDTFALTMDNHQFMNVGKTYYAVGRGVSPEQLVHQMGNMIGFDLKPNEKINDLIQEDRGQELPTAHYAIPKILEDYMDLVSNSFPVMRGEEVTGDHTLGEISMLREAGDSRTELNVKIIEDIFLADMGHKGLCHMDQWARHEDRVEMLGEEDAMALIFLNPRDLPGGYDFIFGGSDRVVNQVIRQRNLLELDARMSASPYLKERPWVELLLEAHDLGDEEENVLLTEEEFAIKQQQELQIQMAMAAAGAQAEGQPGGNGAKLKKPDGPQEPTQAGAAQEAGRAQSQVA